MSPRREGESREEWEARVKASPEWKEGEEWLRKKAAEGSNWLGKPVPPEHLPGYRDGVIAGMTESLMIARAEITRLLQVVSSLDVQVIAIERVLAAIERAREDADDL